MINHRRVLAVAVVVLLIGSLLPADAARVLSSKPRHAVSMLLSPALFVFAGLVGDKPGPGSVGHDPDVQKLYEQTLRINEMLRQENAELREQIGQLTDLGRILDTTTHTPLPATVMAWSSGRAIQTLQINRGRNHGVQPGQMVVSGVELVGVVSDVGPLSATVKLITSSGSRLYVTIIEAAPGGRTRESMTQLDVADNGREFIATVGVEAAVTAGDRVHLADRSYGGALLGYLVGQVVSVQPLSEDPTLRRQVVVRPGVDYARLRRVVVMLDNQQEGGR